MYASNHRSHTDYLVEPLVLDDNGIRPPIIAAGINLFGGPLGLLHRHVTGAIPIRRNTKDPAYLITLKAYVAELLRPPRLFFYPEGGRSYSGEMKTAEDRAAARGAAGRRSRLAIVPTSVAYDLVLEDHVLARQGVKRSQRPFSRELAEMVRYAVGYRSRAFVTFGKPLSIDGVDPEFAPRRCSISRTRSWRPIGRLYKVLPTAVVANAMRPSITRRELESRADAVIDTLRSAGANLGVQSGAEAMDQATRTARGARHHRRRARPRPRPRSQRPPLLRPHARRTCSCRPSTHEVPVRGCTACHGTGVRNAVLLHRCARKRRRSSACASQSTACGSQTASRGGSSPAKPSRRRSRSRAASRRRACILTLDYLGESVRTSTEADAATREYVRLIDVIVASGIERNISLKLTQLGAGVDRATCVDNLRRILEPAGTHGFFVRIDMENSPWTELTLDVFETLWQQEYRNIGIALQAALYRSEQRRDAG